MENTNVIESLGRLSTQCEEQAAKLSPLWPERAQLQEMADRYREAQYEEMVYPLGTVLTDGRGIDLTNVVTVVLLSVVFVVLIIF